MASDRVFNADQSDLRFRDPKNIIADITTINFHYKNIFNRNLYAKGNARYDNTGICARCLVMQIF